MKSEAKGKHLPLRKVEKALKREDLRVREKGN